MGDIFWAPLPVCPVHQGSMTYTQDGWACPGWDGEGCGISVDNEEHWAEHGQPLGTADAELVPPQAGLFRFAALGPVTFEVVMTMGSANARIATGETP